MSGIVQAGGLIGGIITIAMGIVVLIWPRIIAYLIGIWLIIVGILAVVTAIL